MPEPTLGLGNYVGGIPPDEMRHKSVRYDDAEIAPVHGSRNQARELPVLRLGPAMQQDESLPVGTAEQVIGVVFGVGAIFNHVAEGSEVPMGDDQTYRSGFQIYVCDAAASGCHVAKKRIANPGVTIARPAVGDACEITGNSFLPIGAERVDRARQGVFLACRHIQDVAHEALPFPVVPDHFRCRAGNPLQHAALLPAPGFRLPQRNPAVLLVQVDHADLDHVFGGW